MKLTLLFAALAGAQVSAPQSIPVRVEARGAVLAGDLFLPPDAGGRRVPGVVLVHGSGRGERSFYRGNAIRLTEMGMAALLYDKRGVGESTGRYTDVGTENGEQALAQLADDARRALAVLSSQPRVDPARVGLFGASQAGWILPLAADGHPSVRFLVVLSGPAVSVGLEIRHGRLNGEGRTPIGEEELAKQLAAFQGPHGYDPLPVLRRLRTPTLWIMGDRDQNLPLRETLRALDALPAKASGILTLVRFPDADHGLYRDDGSRVDFWDEVRDWLAERGILDPTPAAPR
jgi:dipeptidyl aminopeptidase/acylaminoacyl peptidase